MIYLHLCLFILFVPHVNAPAWEASPFSAFRGDLPSGVELLPVSSGFPGRIPAWPIFYLPHSAGNRTPPLPFPPLPASFKMQAFLALKWRQRFSAARTLPSLEIGYYPPPSRSGGAPAALAYLCSFSFSLLGSLHSSLLHRQRPFEGSLCTRIQRFVEGRQSWFLSL